MTPRAGWLLALVLGLTGVGGAGRSAEAAAPPETIRFPSADGTTTLVGYLFRPDRT